MTHDRYDAIRKHYWVIAFANEKATPFDWLFSMREPAPVPNLSMSWRRPTYAETIERQKYYEIDPEFFEKCASKRNLREFDCAV